MRYLSGFLWHFLLYEFAHCTLWHVARMERWELQGRAGSPMPKSKSMVEISNNAFGSQTLIGNTTLGSDIIAEAFLPERGPPASA